MVTKITRNKITYIALFLSIVTWAFLCIRYYKIGISIDEILLFSIFFLFSISILFVSFKFYNSVINPISIYAPFLILLSYSFIQLSNNQEGYTTNSLLVILFSIFSYSFAATTKLSFKKKDNRKFLTIRTRKLLFRFLFIGAIATFFLECLLIGYIPILKMTTENVYADSNENLIPILHYFITLLAFFPSWLYIYRKQGIISNKKFKILLIITVFILINYLSRQVILLLVLSFFGTYMFYNKISNKLIFRFMVGLISFFLLITIIRFQTVTTTAPLTEYYRIVAGIDNQEVTFTEAFLVEYSSKRFAAFNKIINYADKISFWGFGQYTFKPLTSLLFLDNLGIVSNIPELDTENAVSTYMADPYLDFRYIGVILLNFIYGFLSITFYKRIKKGEEDAIVPFWIVSFCLIMGIFINFFNTMIIWLGFLFNRLLVKPSINE